MYRSFEFFNAILDSITEHIAVIDKNGVIKYVNKSWQNFASNNDCTIDNDWSDINYLSECENAAYRGDDFGLKASKGIKSVIDNKSSTFYFEYACDSPEEQRWFMMRVTPLSVQGENYYIISHQNITERKLAEVEICELARVDGLTDIPNRRTFNEFIHDQYRRCLRSHEPITVAMIDLDHFKILNDTYGHQVGDHCLIEIAKLLQKFTNRATDICARYGGEEFVIVWGETTLEQAKPLAQRLLKRVKELQIPNENSPTNKVLTASIGLCEIIPSKDITEAELIHQADEKLYLAKKNGRDRIEY